MNFGLAFFMFYFTASGNASNTKFQLLQDSFLSILQDYTDCKVYLILDKPDPKFSDNSFISEFTHNTLPTISSPFLLAQTYSKINKSRNLMNYQYAYEKHLFCILVFLVFPENGVQRSDYIVDPDESYFLHPFTEWGILPVPVTKSGEIRITLRSYLFFFTTMSNFTEIAEFVFPIFTEIYLGTVQSLDSKQCKFVLNFVCRHCIDSMLVLLNMPDISRNIIQPYLSVKFRHGICLIHPRVNYFRIRDSLLSNTELDQAYPTMANLFFNTDNTNSHVDILQHLEYMAFYKEYNTHCTNNFTDLESVNAKLDQSPRSMMLHGDIYESPKDTYDIVLRDHTSYNFLTCYQVTNSLSFSSYLSPFDGRIWICIIILLVMLAFVLWYSEKTQNHHESILWSSIKLIKPLIDQAQVSSYFKTLSKSNISFLFGLWLLFGLVLTNIYKCIVTSELVCPLRIYSPWDNYEDVVNFSMLTHLSGTYKSFDRLPGTRFYRYSGFDGSTISENEVIHGILSNTEYRSDASVNHLQNLFLGISELYACHDNICLSEFVKLSINDCINKKYVYADTEVHLNKFYEDLIVETTSTIMEGKYSKGKRPFWRTYDGWTVSINWNENKALRNFRGVLESGFTAFWKNWERIQFHRKPYWSSDKSVIINSNTNSGMKSSFKAQNLSSNILSIFAVFGFGTVAASVTFLIEFAITLLHKPLLNYKQH